MIRNKPNDDVNFGYFWIHVLKKYEQFNFCGQLGFCNLGTKESQWANISLGMHAV